MKRLTYLLAGVFVLSLLLSCESEKLDNNLSDLSNSDNLKKAQKSLLNAPTSDEGITPVIIPGANIGGNRTCEEVATFFNTSFADCGTRINYNEDDGSFDADFPEGLEVVVDEMGFISFDTDGGLIIDGIRYVVGAVIVKGSNAANIYYYGNDGITSDAGLAAPDGHMLSNITFCLKYQPIYIAIKTYYRAGISYLTSPGIKAWAYGDGERNFLTSGWSKNFSVNTFYSDSLEFDLVNSISFEKVGVGKVKLVGDNLVIFLDLKGDPTIANDEGLFFKTFYYVGLSPLNYSVVPDYLSWPTNLNIGNTQTITIPISEII